MIFTASLPITGAMWDKHSGKEPEHFFKSLKLTFAGEGELNTVDTSMLLSLIYKCFGQHAEEKHPDKGIAMYTSTKELLASWLWEEDIMRLFKILDVINMYLNRLYPPLQLKWEFPEVVHIPKLVDRLCSHMVDAHLNSGTVSLSMIDQRNLRILSDILKIIIIDLAMLMVT